MKRPILVLLLTVASSLCGAWQKPEQAHPTSSTPQLPGRQIGLGTFSLNSQQCSSYAAFVSDEFFSDLQSIQTEHGIEFRKGQKVVSFFPDHFMVTIHAVAYSCEDHQPLAAMGVTGTGGFRSPAMMFGLRIHAHWEDAGKPKPIGKMTVTEIPPPAWHEYGTDYFGRYEIKISAHDIPLTNTLVVCISSDEVKPPVCIRSKLVNMASKSPH